VFRGGAQLIKYRALQFLAAVALAQMTSSQAALASPSAQKSKPLPPSMFNKDELSLRSVGARAARLVPVPQFTFSALTIF
jgi:hypothetical protein